MRLNWLAIMLLWQGVIISGLTASCDKACQREQRQALVDLYNALDGENWRARSGWLSSQPYCDWEGVACCEHGHNNDTFLACEHPGTVLALHMYTNNASGTIPDSVLQTLSVGLTFFDVRNNGIYGTLPGPLASAQQLRQIRGDGNKFTGSLPGSWSSLANLTELSLGQNMLTGPLPSSYTKLSKLRSLVLDNNCITGLFPVELFALPELEELSMDDCCFSAFSELAPDSLLQARNEKVLLDVVREGRSMHRISFDNNSMTGPIPGFLIHYPSLLLALPDNQLTGSLPDWTHNDMLQELNLRGNRLRGTLPMLFTGSLSTLDLSGNQISGTLPSVLGYAAHMDVLRLHNNHITGTIPYGYSSLAILEEVTLAGNNLTEGQTLPNWMVMQKNATSLEVVADSSGRLRLLCFPLHAYISVKHVVTLDPSYYSFEHCMCEEGFVAVRELNSQGRVISMKCQDPEVHKLDLIPILVPILCTVSLLLLLGGLAYKFRISQLIAQMRIGIEKRSPPGAEKEVTLVLTDIQGSTELWEWDTELAAEGLALHDKLMRQLMGNFFGYEVSTEGDAFLVAFHEPFDAVAWCLATQLALHYADWPEAMMNHRMTAEETAQSCLKRRQTRLKKWEMLVQGSLTAGLHQSAAAAATAHAPEPVLNHGAVTFDTEMDDSVCSSGEWEAAAAEAVLAAHDSGGSGAGEEGVRFTEHMYINLLGPADDASGLLEWKQQVLFRGMRVRMSVATGYVESVQVHTVTNRAVYSGDVLKKVQAVAEAPHGGQVLVDPETFRGIHNRLSELGGAVLEAVEKMSQQYFACKHIPTYIAARQGGGFSSRHKLGTARSKTSMDSFNVGMADDAGDARGAGNMTCHGSQQQLALHSSRSISRWLCEGWSQVLRRPSRKPHSSSHAGSSSVHIAADVEEGLVRSRAKKRHKKHRRQESRLKRWLRDAFKPMPLNSQGMRATSLSYGVMVIDMGVHELDGLEEPTNLTQLAVPGLEDRTRFFPRILSVRQQTPGFFDAPAAGLQPLGHMRVGFLEPLPEVVMVFCTIDKFQEMLYSSHEAAHLAAQLYRDTVRWLLLAAGGYECQESDCSFMVGFISSEAALEWCLMVQQVMRDLSWPQSVLDLPNCEEERDMHGNVVFRGPKVKMGIYAGVPTRVLPHTTTGRADYFGPLVNRAARLCHAAARGGQVLVGKELMLRIIEAWVKQEAGQSLDHHEVQEYCVYFPNQGCRAWPWLFMRPNQLVGSLEEVGVHGAVAPCSMSEDAPAEVAAVAGGAAAAVCSGGAGGGGGGGASGVEEHSRSGAPAEAAFQGGDSSYHVGTQDRAEAGAGTVPEGAPQMQAAAASAVFGSQAAAAAAGSPVLPGTPGVGAGAAGAGATATGSIRGDSITPRGSKTAELHVCAPVEEVAVVPGQGGTVAAPTAGTSKACNVQGREETDRVQLTGSFKQWVASPTGVRSVCTWEGPVGGAPAAGGLPGLPLNGPAVAANGQERRNSGGMADCQTGSMLGSWSSNGSHYGTQRNSLAEALSSSRVEARPWAPCLQTQQQQQLGEQSQQRPQQAQDQPQVCQQQHDAWGGALQARGDHPLNGPGLAAGCCEETDGAMHTQHHAPAGARARPGPSDLATLVEVSGRLEMQYSGTLGSPVPTDSKSQHSADVLQWKQVAAACSHMNGYVQRSGASAGHPIAEGVEGQGEVAAAPAGAVGTEAAGCSGRYCGGGGGGDLHMSPLQQGQQRLGARQTLSGASEAVAGSVCGAKKVPVVHSAPLPGVQEGTTNTPSPLPEEDYGSYRSKTNLDKPYMETSQARVSMGVPARKPAYSRRLCSNAGLSFTEGAARRGSATSDPGRIEHLLQGAELVAEAAAERTLSEIVPHERRGSGNSGKGGMGLHMGGSRRLSWLSTGSRTHDAGMSGPLVMFHPQHQQPATAAAGGIFYSRRKSASHFSVVQGQGDGPAVLRGGGGRVVAGGTVYRTGSDGSALSANAIQGGPGAGPSLPVTNPATNTGKGKQKKGHELLSELGQQVGLTGGLHGSKLRRRRLSASVAGSDYAARLLGMGADQEHKNTASTFPDVGSVGGSTAWVTPVGSACHSPRAGPASSTVSGQGTIWGSSGKLGRIVPGAAAAAEASPGLTAELQWVPMVGSATGALSGRLGSGQTDTTLSAHGGPGIPCRASVRSGEATLIRVGSTSVLPSVSVASLAGAPVVAALPDQEIMHSLRMGGQRCSRGPYSVQGTETPAATPAGFEGPDIGQTCSELMAGSWLWARQLLVHDLGTFKFKGVAGTHSIVSVTIEELAGRTFPTTIRKGKGEQLLAGKGLEYIIYLLPVDRCRDLLKEAEADAAVHFQEMADYHVDM